MCMYIYIYIYIYIYDISSLRVNGPKLYNELYFQVVILVWPIRTVGTGDRAM